MAKKKETPLHAVPKENQELELFSELQSEITTYVAPTLEIVIVDAQTSDGAIEAAKRLKAIASQVEKKRKELVEPLNHKVREINDFVKKLVAPLERAEGHVRTQLNAYATEQEKIRQAELRRLDDERRERERKAKEEEDRIAAELAARQEAEAEAHVEAAQLFGTGSEELHEQNAELDRQQQKEWEAQQEQFKKDALSRRVEASQKVYDASQDQIKNTRRTWKCSVKDLALVPREFLIIQINEKAILAAKKAGVEVPGIEYDEEVSVAIGSNTYNPRIGRSRA